MDAVTLRQGRQHALFGKSNCRLNFHEALVIGATAKMDIQPLYTKIDKTIQLTMGFLVLESSSGYPHGESNMYLVAPNGKILWKAETPEGNTCFSRVKLNDDGETFSAYTVHGHACELDLRTGKLISFTSIQ